MRVHLLLSAVALIVGIAASGCVGDDASNPFDGEALDVPRETMGLSGDPEDDPPGSLNGYRVPCFWNHGVQATYRQLGAGPLVDSRGYLPSMPNLPAPPLLNLGESCRDQALHYLAMCALPQGSSVRDPVTGTWHHGWLGLTPNWLTAALTTSEQEWMTSCLMQHVNGLDTDFNILLEGNKSGLYYDSVLQDKYPVRESITWGNLFASTTPLFNRDGSATSYTAFQAYVCHRDDLSQDGCYITNILDKRICDTTAECDFVDMGDCTTACTQQFGPNLSVYWNCGNMKSIQVRVPHYGAYSAFCPPDLP